MFFLLNYLFSKKKGNERYKFNKSKLLKNDTSKNPIILVQVGAFNPITVLHTRLFYNARNILEKKMNFKVLGGFISPANDGYQKEGLLNFKDRVRMTELALKTTWMECQFPMFVCHHLSTSN